MFHVVVTEWLQNRLEPIIYQTPTGKGLGLINREDIHRFNSKKIFVVTLLGGKEQRTEKHASLRVKKHRLKTFPIKGNDSWRISAPPDQTF
jgi:hypothetical protein